MTYGALKIRLVQMFPGVSLDLIEGWIQDRYSEILAELDWSRLNVESILLTTAPYTTGTAAVTLGSASIVGTGTAWTAAMSGRAFRVTGRDEIYEFSYVTATTGTLDRVYEGPTGATAGYSIAQAIYPLPSDARLLEDGAFSGLERLTHGQLNSTAALRTVTGTPRYWASYLMDDGSTPPRLQVEFWPTPDTAAGIPFSYVSDAADLTSTATVLAVWISSTALLEGVCARVLRHLEKYTGTALAQAATDKALKQMRRQEAGRMGSATLTLDSYYTSHRTRRGCR